MATIELVRALKELMTRGIWETKDALMKEVIQITPSTFGQLTNEDAFRIISRGNDIVMNYGKSPVYIEPLPISNNSDSERKETVGRCVDLWKSDDILSDTPRKKPKRFEHPYLRKDPFDEPFLDGGILPPKPIKREQYREQYFGDFTIDFESVRKNMIQMGEEVIVEPYPMYTVNFSPPTRDKPGVMCKTVTNITKIKTVGSAEVEEVES